MTAQTPIALREPGANLCLQFIGISTHFQKLQGKFRCAQSRKTFSVSFQRGQTVRSVLGSSSISVLTTHDSYRIQGLHHQGNTTRCTPSSADLQSRATLHLQPSTISYHSFYLVQPYKISSNPSSSLLLLDFDPRLHPRSTISRSQSTCQFTSFSFLH